MNFFALPSLFTSALVLITGAVAFSRNPRSTLHRLFALFCLFTAYWAFVEYSIRQAETYQEAYLWLKIGAFRPMMISFLLHFSFLYIDRSRFTKAVWLKAVIYGFPLGFSIVNVFTDWIKGTPVPAYWGWAFGRNGWPPAQYFFVTSGLAAVALLLLGAASYYRSIPAPKRKNMRPGILVVTGLASAGLICHAAEHLFALEMPEMTSLIGLGFALTLFFAVIRHQIMITPAAAANLIVNAMDEFLLVSGKDDAIQWANRSLLQRSGYRDSEIQGQPVSMLIEPRQQRTRGSAAGEEHHHAEGILRHRSGKELPVILNERSLEAPDGRHVATVLLAHDISLWKKTEAQLRNAERLESLELLVRSISHDFNNLLAAISGHLSLARMTTDHEKCHDHVSTAQDAAMVAAELLKRFSAITKDHEPSLELCAIPDLIEQAVDITLRSAPVSVSVTTGDDIPPVHVDKHQILQVLINILLNARQAVGQHGRIEITVSKPARDSSDSIPAVAVRISDTGGGIEPDILPHIFDLFYTTKETGTGLGLPIAKSIVESHKGTLSVESHAGRGTTFTIELPATQAASSPVIAPQQLPRLSGRILVMEEDTMVRDAIGAILADAGCEVVHVNEGGEAIEHFVATRGGAPAFDAILLDQNVSTGVDGISANRRLKQIDPNVPTILMSGDRTSRHLTNFADHGFRASVAKPFTAQELLAALASVVQRRGAAC